MTRVLQPGDALTPRRVRDVSAATMKMMSVVLADPNPIHLDVEAVAALGLGDRLVNQGPANLAYVIDMVRKNFPSGHVVRFQARMLASVHEGDELTAGGTVERIVADGSGRSVTCRVWLDIDGGKRAVDAGVTIAIP